MDDCLLIEHEAMLRGEEAALAAHDTESCYYCAARLPPVMSICRCGDCCRRLIIEVTLEDAKREPRIRQRCSPLFHPAELTASGKKEHIGFLLNSAANGNACAFLDQTTNLCTIYETRPLVCRLFSCDAEGQRNTAQGD